MRRLKLALTLALVAALGAPPAARAATAPGAPARRASATARAPLASTRGGQRAGGAPRAAPSARGRGDYPIVLLHGAAGWRKLGPLSYFHDVARVLAADGRRVHTPGVDPFQRVAVRAAELAPQIDAILAETGAAKVHLVAHSQGGLDARYLVSSLGYGDRVASVTTIGTPHRGSPLAAPAGLARAGPARVAARVANGILRRVTGRAEDLLGLLHDIDARHLEREFNPTNPDDARVRYFSVAGSGGRGRVNPLLRATHAWLEGRVGANDGLIPVESARWGTFLGALPTDHWGEIGQLAGRSAGGFDHRRFYRDLARFLTDPSAPTPLAPASAAPRAHQPPRASR